jgi:hypothetical protein
MKGRALILEVTKIFILKEFFLLFTFKLGEISLPGSCVDDASNPRKLTRIIIHKFMLGIVHFNQFRAARILSFFVPKAL